MPLPILTVEQMRAWEESSWASGITATQVIAQVGQRLAERILFHRKGAKPVLLLAGKGNNGADVLAAAETLEQLGIPLKVLRVADPAEASRQLAEIERAGEWSLCVDGLFGIGLNRPLDSAWCALLEQINKSGHKVLSVDLPSGLNGDTGQVMGAAIRASVTCTVGAPKIGLLEPKAIPYVGRLEVLEEVGLLDPPSPKGMSWSSQRDFSSFFSERAVTGHKGTFGHVAIIAGAEGYHGASLLAAESALKAMPGLVTLIVPEAIYFPVAAQTKQIMVRAWRGPESIPEGATTVLVGPGLVNARQMAQFPEWFEQAWIGGNFRVVVDASGLSLINQKTNRPGRWITPHPGEAARLLNVSIPEIQTDRPAAARQLCQRFGCGVLLKGHQTLVALDGKEIRVNSTGNPWLAQGGSGDVLAGFIAGLLAPPGVQDEFLTASFAVWKHGYAADLLARRVGSFTVEELLSQLRLHDSPLEEI
jgi:NAD(P)H-hydrate epimerase